MSPLWPRRLFITLAVFTSFGCTGENIEGRWRGPFPLEDAKVCVLNMYSDEKFDLACQDRSWVGGGRFHRHSDDLEFDFEILTHRSRRLKNPQKLATRLVGQGNTILLILPNKAEYSLTRRL